MKRSKQTEGPYANYKYSDKQFVNDASSLGESTASRFPNGIKWHRYSEKEKYHKEVLGDNETGPFTIFKDGVANTDVHQQELGDCYYISALAVLNYEDVRDKFIFESEAEFMQCGAFCIKFYNNGKEDIVIIDDYFAFREGDDSHYNMCISDNYAELWPTIMEKAYAKKYGSFDNIEGGWVQFALADLTGGLPEKYGREEPELQNLQKYWDIILEAFTDGYYLGCGTPSHQDGHDASSDMGLAQGHAYSILRAVEVDKIKLLQIRNPWGRGEWKGDWSDDSELWTTRMQNILKWETFENDGIFWIEFTDFIAEFDDVYICRSLNERNGWKHITIKDKWEGKYAGGIPGFHDDSEFTDLPQYEITINTPGCGKGYWLTRQVEQENASTAKYSNYTLVSAFKNG